MTYEELLKEADSMGLIVKEKPLQSGDGRIFNNKIAIRKDIPTQTEKACVLAEELGHHCTSSGTLWTKTLFLIASRNSGRGCMGIISMLV